MENGEAGCASQGRVPLLLPHDRNPGELVAVKVFNTASYLRPRESAGEEFEVLRKLNHETLSSSSRWRRRWVWCSVQRSAVLSLTQSGHGIIDLAHAHQWVTWRGKKGCQGAAGTA